MNVIEFDCQVCKSPLEVNGKRKNRVCVCPDCGSTTKIIPITTLAETDPSVDVQLGLPGGACLKTNVSRSDSGKMAFTFLGALLALVGLFTGIQINRKS